MTRFSWGMKACGVFLLWAATAVALPAQTFTTLHGFDFTTDGNYPEAALVQGTNGELYGTTRDGINSNFGTVFVITTGGTFTTLYQFSITDGYKPTAALVQATEGNLYGTTEYPFGGTAFKITPSGMLTTLHHFDSTDGADPYGGMAQATNGNLYGTTLGGGANGDGTVFKMTAGGTLTTLYSFCAQTNCTDGYGPMGALTQASNGDIYGTTQHGGANLHGTIFKITVSGTLTTLYSFCSQPGCTDGYNPTAALVRATDGNLYGTAQYGGADHHGTVFKLTPQGAFTTLHSFHGREGYDIRAGLVQATDGDFYGTTEDGGANVCTLRKENHGCGTIFKITAGGALTTLYNFCSERGCTDGGKPVAGLMQATDGSFYGTTTRYGTYGPGTVFSLSVGLGPFVKTLPASGKVGAAVKILGTSLTGATSVTFNGIPQPAFTVVSASEITTTVPTGATTGTVQVVTPGGTLSSNVPFTVN
jgi:uncharacterized repeat protein (TIGR03803 family)